MLVTADAEQMEGILDMRSGGIGSVAIGTLALVHPGMVAEDAFGILLIMGSMIERYRTELSFARKNHDRRTNVSGLRRHGEHENRQCGKDDSLHSSPAEKQH